MFTLSNDRGLRMRKLNKYVSIILLFCFMQTGDSFGRENTEDKLQISLWNVQASWIYNIARFIEFPNNLNNEVSICLIGTDADVIYEKLEFVIKRPTLQGKKVIIRKTDPNQTGKCQIVYQTSRIIEIDKITALVPNQAWISAPGVSTQSNFVFLLRLSNGKIKLFLNKETLKKSKIKLNHSLLRLTQSMDPVK